MSKPDPVLIMAMHDESQGLFESEGIKVHYCGIGKVNAAYMTMKLISQGARCILNLGTAGSASLHPHTTVSCHKFIERDAGHLFKVDPNVGGIYVNTLKLGLLLAICGTGDSFVKELDENTDYQLVDMEGYAMARVCFNESVPFHSYKYITDGGNVEEWANGLCSSPTELLHCYKAFMKAYHG